MTPTCRSLQIESNKKKTVNNCNMCIHPPLPWGVTPMLAIPGCCINLPGCGTALRTVQDKHTQMPIFYNLFQ